MADRVSWNLIPSIRATVRLWEVLRQILMIPLNFLYLNSAIEIIFRSSFPHLFIFMSRRLFPRLVFIMFLLIKSKLAEEQWKYNETKTNQIIFQGTVLITLKIKRPGLDFK
jgi:hypothetical protein